MGPTATIIRHGQVIQCRLIEVDSHTIVSTVGKHRNGNRKTSFDIGGGGVPEKCIPFGPKENTSRLFHPHIVVGLFIGWGCDQSSKKLIETFSRELIYVFSERFDQRTDANCRSGISDDDNDERDHHTRRRLSSPSSERTAGQHANSGLVTVGCHRGHNYDASRRNKTRVRRPSPKLLARPRRLKA